MRETFTAFSKSSLSSVLGESIRIAQHEIVNEATSNFMRMSEADYVAHMLKRFKVEPFEVTLGEFEHDVELRQIRGSDFPPDWNVEPTRYYQRSVYVFFIPFKGNPDLLRYEPSTLHLWQPEMFVEGNYIGFEVLSFRDDAEEIEKARKDWFHLLEQQLINTNRDVTEYNQRLRQAVEAAVKEKRERIRKQEEVATQIGGKRRDVALLERNVGDSTAVPVLDEADSVPAGPTSAALEADMPSEAVDNDPIRVFISYSHETKEHNDRVWDLCVKLTEEGLECHIDIDEVARGMPGEGWQRWMKNQIEHARFVLVVCTPTYVRRMLGAEEPGKGKGANWEGLIITSEIYRNGGMNRKFIPVIFSEQDADQIPNMLTGATYYDLSREEDYDKLYRHLTSQPRRRLPQRGRVRVLPTETARAGHSRPE
jgi:TIR domain